MREITLLPRAKHESSREFAYRILRENIITLALPPGEAINECAVADWLSLSRTPVREAMFTLKKEKMIAVQGQAASTVSLIDLGLLRQGIMMQVMVEMDIIKRLCGNMDEDLCRRYRDNLARQREYIDQCASEWRILGLDDQFHFLSYEATGRQRLYQVVKTMSSQLDRVRFFLLQEKVLDHRNGYGEHKEIFLRMMTAYDDGFAALYLAHRTGVDRFVSRLAERYPRYFTADGREDDRVPRLAAMLAGGDTETRRLWT